MSIRAHALVFVAVSTSSSVAFAADDPNWKIDVGVRGFKYSSESGPNEIGPNRVFDRWERVNQDRANFAVSDYSALEPLYFNFSLGADVMIRFRRHLMVKVGYDYSNPFGIGGTGHIGYRDLASGVRFEEQKSISYTSHQITTFLGPAVPIGESAEVYLGFSPMAPTWVTYKESYSKKANGQTAESYDRTYHGFFGSCRALLGIQIQVWDRLKIGTEMVFAFLNYMKLTSGNIEDSSFRFPNMMWNFTVRYQVH